MLKIKRVDSFGGACPTQAEGFLDDGRPFYMRYRNGYFSFRVGQLGDEDGVMGEEIVGLQDGDAFDGFLEPEDAIRLTANVVEWPSFRREKEVPTEKEALDFIQERLEGLARDKGKEKSIWRIVGVSRCDVEDPIEKQVKDFIESAPVHIIFEEQKDETQY